MTPGRKEQFPAVFFVFQTVRRTGFAPVRFFLSFCLVILLAFQAASSEETGPGSGSNPAADISKPPATFQAAVQFYRNGEIQNALKECEAFLSLNPGHSKAKDLLVEVLVVSAVESYLLGQEDESLLFLTRAMETAPDIETVNRLYEKVKKGRSAVPRTGQPSSALSLPEDAKLFQTVVEKMVQSQKELVTTTQDSLNKMAQTSAEEKKQILNSLDQRENLLVKEIASGKKHSLWLILGGIAIIILVVASVLAMVNRIASRREKILIEQGERFSQLIQEQSGKTLEHLKETLAVLPQLTAQAAAERTPLLEDNTAEKLRRIDIMDAEIVREGAGPTDSKAMDSLLEDGDPSVRARAIQVLLKVDPEGAYQRIQDMVSSGHNRTRILAVKLLSGIATQRSAEILIRLLKEKDDATKRESILALRTILNERLQDETKEQINLALSFVSEKEGWIVK